METLCLLAQQPEGGGGDGGGLLAGFGVLVCVFWILGLLAFLALEPGPHRREQLTALLWGDYPDDKAKASLRQALTHLRDALADSLRVDRAERLA